MKRRTAKGTAGRRRKGSSRRGTNGAGREGRNGIRVEDRSRERRRGLQGDKHGRGDELVADHVEVGRLALSLSLSFHLAPLSLSSLPRVFFVPVSIPLSLSLSLPPSFSLSRFLAPPSLSLCPCYYAFSLSRVLSSVRGVFRGKRPSLVDGPSHGLQLSPNPSRLPDTPYPPAFLSAVSLPFSVLISLFLRRSLSLSLSFSTPRVLFAPRSYRVFFATLHTLRRGKEEGARTKRGGKTERDYHPMY